MCAPGLGLELNRQSAKGLENLAPLPLVESTRKVDKSLRPPPGTQPPLVDAEQQIVRRQGRERALPIGMTYSRLDSRRVQRECIVGSNRDDEIALAVSTSFQLQLDRHFAPAKLATQ